MGFLSWIIVGLIAGWLTGKIMGGQKGVLGDILLGMAGGLLGGLVMRLLGGTGRGGWIYSIILATGGAIVLTWLYRLLTRGRDGTRNIRRAA